MQAMQENIDAWWHLRAQRLKGIDDSYFHLKNATLEYVNSIRAEFMLEPLSELPKGHTKMKDGCVVYNALAGTGVRAVGLAYIHLPTGGRAHPQKVHDFIYAFDGGRIPELVA